MNTPKPATPSDSLTIKTSSELRECPFCGGEAHIAEWLKDGHWHFTANCNACDATATDCSNRDEATYYWNHRVDAALKDQLPIANLQDAAGAGVSEVATAVHAGIKKGGRVLYTSPPSVPEARGDAEPVVSDAEHVRRGLLGLPPLVAGQRRGLTEPVACNTKRYICKACGEDHMMLEKPNG